MVRGIHNRVRVDLVVFVEVRDGAGLAEVFDAEGGGHVAGDGADPGEGGGVAVCYGNEGCVTRDLCHEALDLADGAGVAAGAGPAGGGPA